MIESYFISHAPPNNKMLNHKHIEFEWNPVLTEVLLTTDIVVVVVVELPSSRGGIYAGSKTGQQVWGRTTRAERRSNQPACRKSTLIFALCARMFFDQWIFQWIGRVTVWHVRMPNKSDSEYLTELGRTNFTFYNLAFFGTILCIWHSVFYFGSLAAGCRC